MSNISQPAVQFCSGQAKPLMFVAGSLALIGSVSSIYFILQATTFDPLIISGHDFKLYARLAATFYLSLFAAFTLYAASSEQKSANKFLVILAVINIGLAVGVALTFQDQIGPHINSKDISSPLDPKLAQFCCADNTTTSRPTTPGTKESMQQQANTNVTSTTPTPATNEFDVKCLLDCQPKIDRTILILSIIFFSLAAVNLFILIVSGATVYKTYQYDEANQGAYS